PRTLRRSGQVDNPTPRRGPCALDRVRCVRAVPRGTVRPGLAPSARRSPRARSTAVERGNVMLRLAPIAALLFASPTPAAETEGDLKALQGVWVIAGATLEGRDHLDDFKSMKLTVTGNKYEVTLGEIADGGTIKLDASKTPKQIDLATREKGPFKGRNLPGIYE